MVAIRLLPALAGVVIFLLHLLMEWFVHFHLFFLVGEIAEGLVVAIVGAAVLAYIQALRRRGQRQYQKRLEAVAKLNHHVRNALEVIVAHASGEVRVPKDHLRSAIKRIDWVLRDVEPQLKQTQEPV